MRPTGFAPARSARQTHAWRMALMPRARARRRRPSSLLRGRAPAACQHAACQHARVRVHMRRPTAELVASLLPVLCQAKPSPACAHRRVRVLAGGCATVITGVYLARASQRLCELSGSSVAGASAVPVQMWAGASAVPVQMWAAVHVRGCARIGAELRGPCRVGAEQPIPPVTAVTARTLNSNTLNSNTLNSNALPRRMQRTVRDLQTLIRLGHCGVLSVAVPRRRRAPSATRSTEAPRRSNSRARAPETNTHKHTETNTNKQAALSPTSAPGLDRRCAGDSAGSPNASAPPRTPRASCAKSYIRSQCTDGSGLWSAERPPATWPRRKQVLRRRMAFCR